MGQTISWLAGARQTYSGLCPFTLNIGTFGFSMRNGKGGKAMSVEQLQEQAMLFFAELPDFNRDLFIQQSDNLQQFDYFPKLNPEIRHMIWRECYPKRRKVVLYLDHELSRVFHAQLPITLYVSSESRSVTLSDYLLMSTNKMWSSNGYEGRPICLNPTRDIAIFGGLGLLRPCFMRWLAVQMYSYPRLFRKIESLQIEYMYWGKSWKDVFDRKTPGICTDQCGGALRYFRGLKELVLVAGPGPAYFFPTPRWTDDSVDEPGEVLSSSEKQLIAYFEHEKALCPTNKVPKITFKEYDAHKTH